MLVSAVFIIHNKQPRSDPSSGNNWTGAGQGVNEKASK